MAKYDMFMENKMKKLLTSFLLVALIIGGLAGCGQETPDMQEQETVAAPPSISQEGKDGETQLITLTQKQADELRIQTQVVNLATISYSLKVPGTVFPSPEYISIVSAPVNGRVVAIHAHEGERVRKGDVLVELESLEFANLVAEYLQSRAEEAYQLSQLERLQQLAEKKISPQRALEKAQSDYTRANAATRAAEARLLAIGVTTGQIDEMYASKSNIPRLKITASINGSINEHLIDMGQAVTAYDKMLTILNLEKVLIRGYASPEDVLVLQPGDSVFISLKEYPTLVKKATITTINPALDEVNKSITLNIMADTPDGWPKPGQNVRLDIMVTTPQPVLAVPLSAIEYEQTNATLFVKVDDLTFEKRMIQISKMTADQAIISQGVKAGEKVAVSQVFSLKALSKLEEFAE